MRSRSKVYEARHRSPVQGEDTLSQFRPLHGKDIGLGIDIQVKTHIMGIGNGINAAGHRLKLFQQDFSATAREFTSAQIDRIGQTVRACLVELNDPQVANIIYAIDVAALDIDLHGKLRNKSEGQAPLAIRAFARNKLGVLAATR